MRESDTDYFLRRAGEEREAAERAADDYARKSHLELAQRYEVAAAATAGAPVVQLRTGGRAASRSTSRLSGSRRGPHGEGFSAADSGG